MPDRARLRTIPTGNALVQFSWSFCRGDAPKPTERAEGNDEALLYALLVVVGLIPILIALAMASVDRSPGQGPATAGYGSFARTRSQRSGPGSSATANGHALS
jgi:hypothetical protein